MGDRADSLRGLVFVHATKMALYSSHTNTYILADYAALKRGEPYEPSKKWQAQVNLVFAIGAVYSHLTSAAWRGDERDHLIYHSRAWALGCSDPWWFTHPNLPQMQITGMVTLRKDNHPLMQCRPVVILLHEYWSH